MVEIEARNIRYRSGDDTEIWAYVAYPKKKGRLSTVIIIHEIWGLNDNIREISKRFADQGYFAFAPNLYSRPGSPPTDDIEKAMGVMMKIPVSSHRDPRAMQDAISKLPERDQIIVSKTMQWLRNRDYKDNVKDLSSAIKWLSSQPNVNVSKIASLGFCMGGTLSGRLASSGAALGAAVIFYGESPPEEEIYNIKCPILGLYGADDHRITDTIPEFEKLMKKEHKRFTYKVYKGAAHAFFNDTSKTYKKDAAQDAWKMVLKFFSDTID